MRANLPLLLIGGINLANSLSIDKKPLEESSERLSRWQKRWSDNQIGFHKEKVNEVLLKYGDRIIPNFTSNETCAAPVRVLVPLCGKTLDLAFLAKHASVEKVVGCEGIRKAIEEFSDEHADLGIRELSSSPGGAFEQFQGDSISFVKGDFFQLDETVTGGKFHTVWDRASFVAINPELRDEYVNVLGRLLHPGGKILLATLERREGTDEAKRGGPPFSISEAIVRKLYEDKDWVESVTLLEETDEFQRNPENSERFRNAGVSAFFELVFEIRVK